MDHAKKRIRFRIRRVSFTVISTRASTRKASPLPVLSSLIDNWTLVTRMARRDIETRYRGSFLGTAWTVLVPLVMLAVYTFVFGSVLRLRWAENISHSDSPAEFAIILFSGLILFWTFSDVVSRAPNLVRENVTYVTKIVFPLHVLPWVAMVTGLFNLAVSMAILVAGQTMVMGPPPPTALLAPLVLLPFVLLIMGLSWLFASIGMFVRDLHQVVTVSMSALMFLSPVFYPLEVVNQDVRWLFYLNPLTFIVQQFREVMLWGRLPDWWGLAIYSGIALLVAWLGLLWFQKTRKGFADVI